MGFTPQSANFYPLSQPQEWANNSPFWDTPYEPVVDGAKPRITMNVTGMRTAKPHPPSGGRFEYGDSGSFLESEMMKMDDVAMAPRQGVPGGWGVHSGLAGTVDIGYGESESTLRGRATIAKTFW